MAKTFGDKALFPDLGRGLGLRPCHYSHVLEFLPAVDWFEVISENYMGLNDCGGGRPLENLEKIRNHYPIACHGVSLSIGSTDPLDFTYLKKLKHLIDRFEPSFVSDHLCWTGVCGENLHDLLPLPYTEEVIQHVTQRIGQVQDFLGRRILIENLSSYITFKSSEMPEWNFIDEIARRSDCGILLDINNIYVSSKNHGFEPLYYVKEINRARVGQIHLAGHTDYGDCLIDTHDEPVSDVVWDLYKKAIEVLGSVSTMIERDGNIPPFTDLMEELSHAQRIREDALGKSRSVTTLAQVGDHPSPWS